MRRLVVLAVLALVTLAPVTRAHADEAEAARTHFAAGVKLYDARDYAAALAEFQAAYAAKRSPQIKRNVALCLRGLGQYPEAMDALEEMLSEGGDALKPEVKDGAKQAILEMTALVATVHVRVVSTGHTPPSQVTVTLDDKPIPPERFARPLRVLPGEHVFHATATGYFEAMQRVRFSAGQPDTAVDLGLVAVEVAARGRLSVQTNVMTARLTLDGVEMGHGSWTGEVAAGTHRVDATAAGYATHTVTVTVPANGQEAISVDMTSAVDAPAPIGAPRAPRLWYVTGGIGLFGESLTPTFLGLDDTGTKKRAFGGAGLIVHGGRLVGKHLALGVVGELGGMGSAAYDNLSPQPDSAGKRDSVAITQWVLAPEVRLLSSGMNVRAFGGFALGLAGQVVNADHGGRKETGASASGIALLEGGGQLDLGRLFVEAALFADVHGTSTTNTSNNRYFSDSSTVRAGLRVLVGYRF